MRKLKKVKINNTLVFIAPRECTAQEAREMVRYISLFGDEEAKKVGADRVEVRYREVI